MQIAKTSESFGYGFESGVYVVNNPCNDDLPFSHGTSPIQARCNLDSNGGGWIVLLKRTPEASEQTSLSRKWKDYENGFGNLTGEFWYGLKNMHCLTSREPMEVEVEMSKTDGTRAFLSYGNFRIDGPSTSYTLHVSDKQHEGGDELAQHNGMKFTTTDRDNDKNNENCTESFNRGGWWFNSCYTIHLTDSVNPRLESTRTQYDYAELRVRPKTCSASCKY